MDVDVAAAVELPAMTIPAVGTTGSVTTTVHATQRDVAPDVRECPKRMTVTADRAAPLPGTREEREDATIIPVFPVMILVAVMRIKVL